MSRRPQAKLTLSQVRAAWTLYKDAGLSLDDLAERLWQLYGYASKASCHKSLHEAFTSEGKKLRTRREAALLRLERDPEARRTLRRAVARAREVRLARKAAA